MSKEAAQRHTDANHHHEQAAHHHNEAARLTMRETMRRRLTMPT